MIDLNAGSGFTYGRPYTPPPPVKGVITDPGVGKTREWRTRVAADLIAAGRHPALAVPLHQLGDEIVFDFAVDGIVAHCYRGRDAEDPLAPGHKMCREQERIGVISQALGDVSRHACKRGNKQCRHFETCCYQRQQRLRPQVSLFAHQFLFQERPSFIQPPDALGIDEGFWDAGLRGQNKLKPEKFWLCSLKDDRRVPKDDAGTADLVATSDRVHTMLLRENSGFIRRTAILDAGITVDELQAAWQLEWRRKKDINDVFPDMPLKQVQQTCALVAIHNQDVRRLAKFWELLIRTLESDAERSPYLYLNPNEHTGLTGANTQPAVRMIWRENIHESWLAPTTVMDATMSEDIVRQFLPGMPEPVRILAATPHTYVRQIIDKPMSARMLIQSASAKEKTNRTRQNHVSEVWKFIETRANEVRPGRVLVVCQLDLQTELDNGALPGNVEFGHFNGIAGVNTWNEVALLILIGRTEPPPREVERLARALFDADIAEIPDGHWYPKVEHRVQMRDGPVAAIPSPTHPDPRAEAVRWQICEAELIQAIGRGRAVNRTADNPLKIDIVTNYPLPIVVDELTTWALIQPTDVEIMRSRGAVPTTYRDMATAYPDLFTSEDAARNSLTRKSALDINSFTSFGGQTPKESYLIGVCPGFLSIPFKRKSFHARPSKLLFDPKSIDPLTWLTERIGDVNIKGKARKPRSRSQGRRKRW